MAASSVSAPLTATSSPITGDEIDQHKEHLRLYHQSMLVIEKDIQAGTAWRSNLKVARILHANPRPVRLHGLSRLQKPEAWLSSYSAMLRAKRKSTAQ